MRNLLPTLTVGPLLLMLAAAAAFFDNRALADDKAPAGEDPSPIKLQAQEGVNDALIWAALETHGKVILQIGGKDINLKKHFEQGENPNFNALKEDLKPGIYSYRIEFIPNRIQEDRDNLNGILDERKKLLALRRVAMESGDREEAKRLYAESNKLRTSAGEMMKEHQETEYEIYEKPGQEVAEKKGTVKIFNLEAHLKKQHEEDRRRKELTPPEREKGAETEI